ncbi:MAG: hypothetical protein ORN85_09955 [Sediminibacterium sp.]|nr:hypothetical protein [Sediminibacterium sp.]
MKLLKPIWVVITISNICIITSCVSNQNKQQLAETPPTALEQTTEFLNYLKSGNFVDIPADYFSPPAQSVIIDKLNQEYHHFSRQQRYNCRQMSIIIDSIVDKSPLITIYFHTNYARTSQYISLKNFEKSYKIYVDSNFKIYQGI